MPPFLPGRNGGKMSINRVMICGNLVRDPEVRYESKSQKAVARVTVALDRGKTADGVDKGADYPQAVFWGGLAEYVEKYARKGMLVAIEGKIRTGSYKRQKDGVTVYTFDVAGDKIQIFRQRDEDAAKRAGYQEAPTAADVTGSDDWSSQQAMDDFLPADDMPF